MRIGTVKWFSNVKGFGFIEGVNGPDIFVHYSAIEEEGFRKLKGGQQVAFDLEEGPKGPHALRVRKVETAVAQAAA